MSSLQEREETWLFRLQRELLLLDGHTLRERS